MILPEWKNKPCGCGTFNVGNGDGSKDVTFKACDDHASTFDFLDILQAARTLEITDLDDNHEAYTSVTVRVEAT